MAPLFYDTCLVLRLILGGCAVIQTVCSDGPTILRLMLGGCAVIKTVCSDGPTIL